MEYFRDYCHLNDKLCIPLVNKELGINSVMAKGRWHMKDGVQKIFGTFENKQDI